MHITQQILLDHGACDSDVNIFSDEWPDGVDLTLSVLQRANELELNISWFAEHFLTYDNYTRYVNLTHPHWYRYVTSRPMTNLTQDQREHALRTLRLLDIHIITHLLNAPLD